MAEGLEAVCPCAHVLGSPRTDTACVIERCECDDALYYDDADACEDPFRTRCAGGEERLHGALCGGGERRKIPHCYSTICLWIRKILRGMWRAGGGGRWCWQWRASGPGVGGYREPGPSREFKISAWCAAVVVGIGCVNQE